MTEKTTEGGGAGLRPSIVVGQICLAAVGVYIVVGSLGLGFWTDMGPGPGFFPLVLSILLIVLCAIWFLQERSGKQTVPENESPSRLHVVSVVVSLVILGAVMPLIGFQLGVFIFLMYHLKIRAKMRWLGALIVSVCGSFGVYWLFTAALNVSLPTSNLIPLQMIGL